MRDHQFEQTLQSISQTLRNISHQLDYAQQGAAQVHAALPQLNQTSQQPSQIENLQPR